MEATCQNSAAWRTAVAARARGSTWCASTPYSFPIVFSSLLFSNIASGSAWISARVSRPSANPFVASARSGAQRGLDGLFFFMCGL